jgi:hypothetical protein
VAHGVAPGGKGADRGGVGAADRVEFLDRIGDEGSAGARPSSRAEKPDEPKARGIPSFFGRMPLGDPSTVSRPCLANLAWPTLPRVSPMPLLTLWHLRSVRSPGPQPAPAAPWRVERPDEPKARRIPGFSAGCRIVLRLPSPNLASPTLPGTSPMSPLTLSRLRSVRSPGPRPAPAAPECSYPLPPPRISARSANPNLPRYLRSPPPARAPCGRALWAAGARSPTIAHCLLVKRRG